MTTTNEQIVEAISAYKPGERTRWETGDRGWIAVIRRLPSGSYEVEVAWRVPESYGDDPRSFDGLLAPGTCEIGWAASFAAAEDAAACYAAARDELEARKRPAMPKHGERRGTVAR